MQKNASFVRCGKEKMAHFQSGSLDFAICRQFGTHQDNYSYKITNPKYHRIGAEETDENRSYTEKGTVNDEKLDNNLHRTRSRIYELASCNPWQYFVTFTFNADKIDRTAIKDISKSLSQFIRDKGKKYGRKIDYLLVPETHADLKAWHLHGLLNGLPLKALKEFTDSKNTPIRIREMVKQGRHIFTWSDFAKRFGHCTLEPVRNHEAVSKYITKYITKDLERMVSELGAHMFYASKGLKSAEVIAKGQLTKALEPNKTDDGILLDDNSFFENEYCRIKRLYNANDALSYFDYGEIPTVTKECTPLC